jgi:C_GCAxxG_C_C family probable redox protein
MNNLSKADEAVSSFHNGFNCAQSVFVSYCDEFGLDKSTALKLSCGLGGGMGRLGETCGAVTGAYLLIGLKYGKYTETDDAAKEKTYATVREFAKLFKQRNGSTQCIDLLGVDPLTGDLELIKQQHDTVCPKAIRDAIEIVDTLLFAE